MSLRLKTRRIILNSDNYKPNDAIVIKKGCINTIPFEAIINDKGGTLEIPVGSTAKIRMRKPGGGQVLNDCSPPVNNAVPFNITELMQQIPGSGEAELIILNGTDILTTVSFPIIILPNVHDDSQLESLPEYTSLLNAIVAVDGKLGKADDVANNSATFVEASADMDIASGEKLSIIFGKLLKSIKTLRTGKMSTTSDSKDNTVTFTEASTDTDIVTGEKHSAIFGKILKSIKTLRAVLADKIDKLSLIHNTTTNDTTKVPSSAVTYGLQQQINAQNDNLANKIVFVDTPLSVSITAGAYTILNYTVPTEYTAICATTYITGDYFTYCLINCVLDTYTITIQNMGNGTAVLTGYIRVGCLHTL
jgi:hypothetical protein